MESACGGRVEGRRGIGSVEGYVGKERTRRTGEGKREERERGMRVKRGEGAVDGGWRRGKGRGLEVAGGVVHLNKGKRKEKRWEEVQKRRAEKRGVAVGCWGR